MWKVQFGLEVRNEILYRIMYNQVWNVKDERGPVGGIITR